MLNNKSRCAFPLGKWTAAFVDEESIESYLMNFKKTGGTSAV